MPSPSGPRAGDHRGGLFTGLSAFPLTPLKDDVLDEESLAASMTRLAGSGVDSITVLGSTGSYAYLSRAERATAVRIAVGHADGVPVLVGVGALRTSHVRALTEDAQDAGAAGVLLAPVSYQRLTDDDVYGLYADVTRDLSVPLVVYDNPGTTHVVFSDELHGRIAALPHVASVKIPGLPADVAQAAARVDALRRQLPDHVTIGISGDASAAVGLTTGCAVWYSVLGGTLPHVALALTRAAQAGDTARATAQSARLQPLWDLFGKHGSLRVVAAIAEAAGLAHRSCLPLPIRGLTDQERVEVATVVEALALHPTGRSGRSGDSA